MKYWSDDYTDFFFLSGNMEENQSKIVHGPLAPVGGGKPHVGSTPPPPLHDAHKLPLHIWVQEARQGSLFMG